MSATTELRAEALFCSPLQPSEEHTAAEFEAAVTATLNRLHEHGVAAVVAQECGDHPDTACPRMRWAIRAARLIDA